MRQSMRAIHVLAAPIAPVVDDDDDPLPEFRPPAIPEPPCPGHDERVPEKLMHPKQQALRPDGHITGFVSVRFPPG